MASFEEMPGNRSPMLMKKHSTIVIHFLQRSKTMIVAVVRCTRMYFMIASDMESDFAISDIPFTYNIILPEYTSSYLTALQNSKDDAVYTSFDDNSDVCVVDNCANVHIWNNRSDFIPKTYIKFDESASTSVSAVNGASNTPAGCGDVAVSFTDDKGVVCDIILKNVLQFPQSPVNNLSIVCFAEQMDDDFGTWIKTYRN